MVQRSQFWIIVGVCEVNSFCVVPCETTLCRKHCETLFTYSLDSIYLFNFSKSSKKRLNLVQLLLWEYQQDLTKTANSFNSHEVSSYEAAFLL